MMRVVTIAREYGSGGGMIARMIADRLQWRLLDRDIIDEVVRMADVERSAAERCDERMLPAFQRVLKRLWQGGFGSAGGAIDHPVFDSESMTRCARTIIEAAADAGNCVIVGRGAQCIVGDRDDTLNVFIWAPRAWRIRRLRRRMPEEKSPEALMDRMDRERAAYIRGEFETDWSDYRLYDIIINSALGELVTVECILAAARGDNSGHG
jgi:cytidylate kinase